MIALALLAQVSTGSVALLAERGPAAPRLLVLPPITGAAAGLEPASEEQMRAFSAGLVAASRDAFGFRRWTVLAGEDAAKVLEVAGLGERCVALGCVEAAADAAAATHWLSAVVFARADGCRARLKLYDRAHRRLLFDEQSVAPCEALEAAAMGLVARVAEGPRAPLPVDLALTSLPAPSIDLPDLPDLAPAGTASVARPPGDHALERALGLYRVEHLILFVDGGRTYVARDGRLLDDCAVLRAAGRGARRCEGNLWELGWLGVPLGAGLAALAVDDEQGKASALTLTFLGASVALTGAILAAVLNEDAIPPGERLVSEAALAEMVQEVNRELRRALALADAEVVAAGLRL